jgi:transposase
MLASMSLDVLLRENDALRKELTERDSRIADLESQLDVLAKKLKLTARERQLLEEKLKQLQALRRRHPYLDPGQGVFAFEGEEQLVEAEPRPEHVDEAPDGETPDDSIRGRHKPKKPARKLDTSNLPVEHVQHELPVEERVCATTGKELVPVGERLEETVEYQPGFIKLIVHHRVMYGLSEEDAEERQAPEIVAPGPPRPLEGSVVGPELLAWILVQKYERHLPLYRQEEILARHGLRIPRQTTCDWVLGAASQLGPIQEALRRSILATQVVQTDDTPVKCQRGRGQGNFLAHLWTTASPLAEGVLYDFTETREHDHLFVMFPGFEEGVLLGDGYAGYDSFAAARRRIVVAGCWAHSLRKFRDALTEAPLLAASAMTHIGKLFDLEKEARERELSLEEHLTLRRERSAKVLQELEAELEGWRDLYSESGKMGEACKYLENQRDHLRVFLGDAHVPIHNNACEVAVRPVAVGRRNWLFAGSVRGGCAAATIYTLVESCKKADVDPYRYLADVLIRVATHPASRVDDLIPANWKRIFGPTVFSAS